MINRAPNQCLSILKKTTSNRFVGYVSIPLCKPTLQTFLQIPKQLSPTLNTSPKCTKPIITKTNPYSKPKDDITSNHSLTHSDPTAQLIWIIAQHHHTYYTFSSFNPLHKNRTSPPLRAPPLPSTSPWKLCPTALLLGAVAGRPLAPCSCHRMPSGPSRLLSVDIRCSAGEVARPVDDEA